VVIYRLGSLGDTIVALPCFHAIAQTFPAAERIVLTNYPVNSVAAPLEAVLGRGALVARYISYPTRLRTVSELATLRNRIAALEADTLIYLASSRGLASAWRDFLFFKSCGFARIVGIPLTPDLQANRVDVRTGMVEPECERLVRTLSSFAKIDLNDRTAWDLLLSDDERAAGATIIAKFEGHPFIAIHTGGKAVEKDWGEANWRELLADLSATHGDHGLLLLGAGEDQQRYSAVVGRWPGLVVNAAGALSPRACAAALQSARLFIGHDSGPLHLASVSGTPSVGLFGSYNLPRKWHPYIGEQRIIYRPEGILAIRVGEVAGAARDLLTAAASAADFTLLSRDSYV
jgi:ADP-heptose:LPS heptosyltransferase